MKLGTQQSTIIQNDIYNNNITSGVFYGKISAKISSTGVNIISELHMLKLSAQSTYLLGVYLNSTIGVSDIEFK
jgi:hypothetical protein